MSNWVCNLEAFNKLGHHRCSGCNNNGGGSDGILSKLCSRGISLRQFLFDMFCGTWARHLWDVWQSTL